MAWYGPGKPSSPTSGQAPAGDGISTHTTLESICPMLMDKTAHLYFVYIGHASRNIG